MFTNLIVIMGAPILLHTKVPKRHIKTNRTPSSTKLSKDVKLLNQVLVRLLRIVSQFACLCLDVFQIPPRCNMLERQTSLPCCHFIFSLAVRLRRVCGFNLIAAAICGKLIDFSQHCSSYLDGEGLFSDKLQQHVLSLQILTSIVCPGHQRGLLQSCIWSCDLVGKAEVTRIFLHPSCCHSKEPCCNGPLSNPSLTPCQRDICQICPPEL